MSFLVFYDERVIDKGNFMSLKVLIIGVFLQLAFAVFQFMVVIFAVGSVVNTINEEDLTSWQMAIVNYSIFILPGVSILVSILLIFLYIFDSRYLSNGWHVIPFVALFLGGVFLLSLNR